MDREGGWLSVDCEWLLVDRSGQPSFALAITVFVFSLFLLCALCGESFFPSAVNPMLQGAWMV
jgi:hypothetical protein